MGKVLWLVGSVTGILILLKLVYALSTALVLPRTQGAMFVSTSRTKLRAILDELKLSPTTKVVDLGCGDGRFLRAVWRQYRVRAVGYEINPWAYFLARTINFFFRVPAEVRFGDFMRAEISGYDVIFCYLFPDLLKDLADKLRQETQPGAIVISCNFPLQGFVPYKVIHQGDPIYFYRIPEKNGPDPEVSKNILKYT